MPTTVETVCASLAVVFGISLLAAHQLLRSSGTKEEEGTQQTVVIVGASSGIGKELALLYAANPNVRRLVLSARRANLLEAVKTECEQVAKAAPRRSGSASSPPSSLEIVLAVADITSDAGVQELLEASVGKSNTKISGSGGGENSSAAAGTAVPIDKLILNAGAISTHLFVDYANMSEAEAIMRINYFAPVAITQKFLPHVRQARGVITVVSSMAGKIGAPSRSLYAGSKHALHGFFDSLRCEVEKDGVSVVVVCPGTVDTDLRASAVDKNVTNRLDKDPHGSTSGKLSPKACAERIALAATRREREVYVPSFYFWAILFRFFFPEFIDRAAKKKYNLN